MRNKNLIPLLLAAILAVNGGQAVAAEKFGFYELYRMAADSDPSIKRAEAQIESSRADRALLETRFNPRANANLSFSQVSESIDYGPATSERGSTVNTYNYGLSGYVSLYDARNYSALKSQEFDARSAEMQLSSSRNDLVAKFADSYFSLLKAVDDLRIAKEEAVRIKAVQDQANAFLKAGTGDIIAVHEAKARYDGIMADVNRYENQLTLARQRLSLLVGRAVEEVADVSLSKALGPEPDDLNWWVERLEQNDPVLKAIEERLKKVKFDTESAYDDHYPVFQAFGGYNVSNGSPFSPDLQTRQWNLGIGVTIPIYLGGEVDARVARGVTSQSEQRYFLLELKRQRLEFLRLLYYDLKYGVVLIDSLGQRMTSVELQLAAIKKGRDIGTRTAIDLLNAEEGFSVAQRDYRKAIYDNIVKNIQLRALVGMIDEAHILPDMERSGATKGTTGAESK